MQSVCYIVRLGLCGLLDGFAPSIGQKKPVHVYQLIAENTVESKVLDIQKKKNNLISEVSAIRLHIDSTNAPRISGVLWHEEDGNSKTEEGSSIARSAAILCTRFFLFDSLS